MLRREIDCRHPVFMCRTCGTVGAGFESDLGKLFGEDAPGYRDAYLTLRSSVEAHPEWMRPYLVYQITIYPYRPSETDLAWIEELLTVADRIGVWCVWEVAGHNSNDKEENRGNCAPCEAVESMLCRHPSLLGVDIVEQSCTDGFIPLRRPYFCEILTLCAKYGAYVFWKEMGYPQQPHPMTIMGCDADMLDAVRRCADNLVLVNKRNGTAKHLQSSGCALGCWLMALCHAWGVNSESWMQYESGHTALFRSPEMWRLLNRAADHSMIAFQSINTAPETMFAQQILPDLAMGACVFSEEAYDQIVADEPTPIFREVLAPLFREAVSSDIIPDKETVRQKLHAAYLVSDLDAPEISSWGYGLYRGLCWADTPDSFYEKNSCSADWLPRCGRYGAIPLLPGLATEEELTRLGDGIVVLGPASCAALFPTEDAKRAWFNERYPEEFAGDAWGISVGDWWYFMHPEENRDDVKHFSMKTKRRGVEIRGELYHHTVGYLHECDTTDEMWLSNLCSDSSSIWDGIFGDQDHFRIEAYRHKMMYEPDLSRRDPTRLVFRGVEDVAVAGDCDVTKERDGDALILTVRHNGSVRLTF